MTPNHLHCHRICIAVCLMLTIHPAFAADTTLQSTCPFPFGASINTTLLRNNPAYQAVVAREYSSLTPENVMKMASIHPGINTYNWINADTLVNFAQQYNKRVHGHTLVWHQSLPAWVTGFAGDSAAWEDMFKSHIQTVAGHYAGRLASWDVVNEAFNDNGTLRSSLWLQHLGPGYIARAFQYAHAADPAALLFYNDYGHEYSTAKLNAIDSLLRSFLLNGIPVHGVGLQLHINKNTNNAAIANAVKIMAQTGLRVHLSELDISMNPEGNQSLAFTPALSQLQADKYNFIVRLYKTLPAAQQHGITTWNVSDADTWITTTYSRPDWPLPFDTLYQKKQAYQAIVEAITSSWNYDAAVAQSAAGVYTDLGTNGTAITNNFTGSTMTFDNDNSSVQNIGFPFFFNGALYQQFVLNTNGYLKLGAAAPSSPALFYPTYNANTNGVITAPDTDVLYPYNHGLTGTAATEYRVYTTGLTGSRVCIIQYKAVADKLAPTQYTSMNFQVRLYEGSNAIEFVYGSWIAGVNASTLITGAVGIKGSFSNTSVNLAKGSGNSWAATLGTANGIYFINGDYAIAGPQFNTRNTALPDAGRTYRFTAFNLNALPVTWQRFTAVDQPTGIVLNWMIANEVNNKSFEVQRSLNGIQFTPIGTVPANANTGAAGNYRFTDEYAGALNGTIYYRLKQMDMDGSSRLSPLVRVYRNHPQKGLSLTAQNPFKNNATLQVVSVTPGSMVLYVSNAAGVILVKKQVVVPAGATHLVVKECDHLPTGIYLVRCVKDNETCLLRLLKK